VISGSINFPDFTLGRGDAQTPGRELEEELRKLAALRLEGLRILKTGG